MRLGAVVLTALVGLGGCSFLVDFNELSRAEDALDAGGGDAKAPSSVGGATSDAGSGGASPAGGADAGPAADAGCPPECDDGDPCTVDTCPGGRCGHAHTTGVVEDGFATQLELEDIQAVSLLGSGDRFYIALFGQFEGQPDVQLGYFDIDGDELVLKDYRLSGVVPSGQGAPVSGIGLATDEAGLQISAYGAIGASATDAGVWRLGLSTGLDPTGQLALVAARGMYQSLSPYAHPVAARTTRGRVFVAWPGPGGVYLQDGVVPRAFGACAAVSQDDCADLAEPVPITGLAPIHDGDQQGAIWTVGTEVKGQLAPVAFGTTRPGTISQCAGAALPAGRVVAESAGIGGLWLAAFTKTDGQSFFSDVAPIACQTTALPAASFGSCARVDPCDASATYPGTFNPVVRTLRRAGDPAGLLYSVAALPVITAGGVSLHLSAAAIDFSSAGAQTVTTDLTPEPVVIRSAAGAPVPDRPELALLGDRVGVTWIEDRENGPSELHLARYRMCFPE